MESTGEMVTKLNEPSAKRSAAIEKFIKLFGNIHLFNDKGINFLGGLRLELEDLYKKTEPTPATQKSHEALSMLINILKMMAHLDEEKKHPNNNFNFLNDSQEAKQFYAITFPNGTTTPKISNDLDAAVGLILQEALGNFKPSDHLPLGVRVGYWALGNPVEAAKNDLGAQINHYELNQLLKIVRLSNSIEGDLSQLGKSRDPISEYKAIASKLADAKIDFTQNQATGSQALCSAILLPQLLACQDMLLNKCGVPRHVLDAIPINLPKPSDPTQFQGNLLKFCDKLSADINPLLPTGKDAQKQQSPLKYLQKDIAVLKNDIRSNLPVACQTIQLNLLETLATVYKKGADPKSVELLTNAIKDIKALTAQYTPSMSVGGLKLPQEHTAKPDSTPKVGPNETSSAVSPRK